MGNFVFVEVSLEEGGKKIWLGTFFGSDFTISFSGSVIVFSGLVDEGFIYVSTVS